MLPLKSVPKCSLNKPVLKNIFIIYFRDDDDGVEEIKSMPGQNRWGINKLDDVLRPAVENGLTSVLLFGVPTKLPKVLKRTTGTFCSPII